METRPTHMFKTWGDEEKEIKNENCEKRFCAEGQTRRSFATTNADCAFSKKCSRRIIEHYHEAGHSYSILSYRDQHAGQ